MFINFSYVHKNSCGRIMEYFFYGSGIIALTGCLALVYRKPKILNSVDTISSAIIGTAKDILLGYFSPHMEDRGDIRFVQYRHANRIYRIPVSAIRGRTRIIRNVVFSPEKTDMDSIDFFISIWGPYRNFHGQKLTPKTLGYDSLKISTTAGEYNFERDDIINIDIDIADSLTNKHEKYGEDQHDKDSNTILENIGNDK